MAEAVGVMRVVEEVEKEGRGERLALGVAEGVAECVEVRCGEGVEERVGREEREKRAEVLRAGVAVARPGGGEGVGRLVALSEAVAARGGGGLAAGEPRGEALPLSLCAGLREGREVAKAVDEAEAVDVRDRVRVEGGVGRGVREG